MTYETLGFGGVAKALGPKLFGVTMKAINSTKYSRKVFDSLNWGGEVMRTHPAGTVPKLRGGANTASAQGGEVERHMMERYSNVVDGKDIVTKDGRVRKGTKLTDTEKLHVGQALNGEENLRTALGTWPGLTEREAIAYRQLRTLTAMDYSIRLHTALSDEFTTATKSLSQADKDVLHQSFRAGKPPAIPEPLPHARVPYGEPVARERTIPTEPVDWVSVLRKQTDDLSVTDRAAVSKSLTSNELLNKLPPELRERAQTITDAIRGQYSPFGRQTEELAPKPREHRQPANQKEIERMERLNKIFHQINAKVDEHVPYRQHYFPVKHFPTAAERRAGRPGFTVNPADRRDPRTIERQNVKVRSPKQLQQGFEAMASNAGRQVTTKAIRDSLGTMLDDPAIKKLFDQVFPAKGGARTTDEALKEEWLRLVGYPRAATVSFTPRHGANILDLVANTVPVHQLPATMAKVTGLALKLWRSSPRQYAELTKEGRMLGAISGKFRERTPFFQKFSDWVPGVGGKGTGPIGWWTRGMNKLVWAIDDAAKQTYGVMLRDSGEAEGLEAGGLASQRLVDYEHLSPVQKALREIAPFGTFRGGIPGAVLGGIARNPARAAFLNRLTGGTMYGGKPDTGQPGVSLSVPTADVGRGLTYNTQKSRTGHKYETSGPAGYMESTLAAPASAALGAGLDAMFPSRFPASENPVAYGQTWLPKRLPDGRLDLGFLADSALAGVFEAGAMLEAMGFSRYQWHGLAIEGLRQSTGINVTPADSGSGGMINWNAVKARKP